jgi:uncharacterized repeat protein (TIGR04138 family)
MQNNGLAELVRRDSRYAYEAYPFVFEALKYTQIMLNRVPRQGAGEEPGPQHHVRGAELLEGVRLYALRQFGMMARTVFHQWGIRQTDDFGEIIFNLVDAQLMSKTDEDTREDFHHVYNFEQAFVEDFEIKIEEAD